MKQISHLNEQIRQEIMDIESECEYLGQKMEDVFKEDFHELKEQIVIELIREVKGRPNGYHINNKIAESPLRLNN